MSEVNQNSTSFNAQSDSELVKTIEITVDEVVKDEVVSHSDRTFSEDAKESCNPKQKIDWHKIAHKLREQNRKLFKQVFQLEQEKADLDNRLQKQLETSYSSDATIAKQAAQIEHSLEQISLLTEQLEISRQEARSDRDTLNHLAQKLESSQQHTARLERECALLQENHNEKTYQLLDKDKQIQKLSARLRRQEDKALQDDSTLNMHERHTLLTSQSTPAKITRIKNQPIQAWSMAMREQNLPLPETSQSTPNNASRQTHKWLAPAIAKSEQTKIESLAAVKLPKFPRKS
ncbi:hypothetical protein [Myxosarcina sp. GI1]|uniref:hypothetical protein n=1 Tax=Myxosarcina sp. GI1 TaxID=1541065 RepID=UPI0005683449|nr:hypothetical protein [Myxosarcina sp. GI1]